MKLHELENAITSHRGTFLCEALSDASITRSIAFQHQVEPPTVYHDIPDLYGLRDFYAAFGNIVFYADQVSGDAAILIATPHHWDALRTRFHAWIRDLSAAEREEYLPDWVDTALVVGEEPHTGNYLLIPTSGEFSGHVYLFDHDGFEFIALASDLANYAWKLLKPDDDALRMMASHMRFEHGESPEQWWIRELHDNRGHSARTYE